MTEQQAPYLRIAEDLRQRIFHEEWETGERIPARHALAEQYGVAIATLERAVGLLQSEGLLVARGKTGTYVAPHQLQVTLAAPLPVSALLPVLDPLPTRILYAVGIVCEDPGPGEQNVQPRLAELLEQQARSRGLRVDVFSLARYGGRYETAITAAHQAGMNALIVLNIYEEPCFIPAIAAQYAHLRLPLLYITSENTPLPFPCVNFDQVSLGYAAATHLLQAGYRRLCYLTPFGAAAGSRDWVKERYAGLRAALQHQGMPDGACLRYPEHPARDLKAHRALRPKVVHDELCALIPQALTLLPGQEPVALVAPNDYLALHVLSALQALGYRPGDDVGVLGFDDEPRAIMHGLTSVRPSWEQICQTALQLLTQTLAGGAIPLCSTADVCVQPRASTRCARLIR